jgi:IS30 family transposase
VANAVIEIMKLLPVRTYTIMVDNGKEFADHEFIAMGMNADVCFAHPCSSCESID